MADLKPPRLVADERATVLALLQFQRESVVRKVAGVSDEDARRRCVPSDTTLLWLVRHLARAESVWLEHRFIGTDPVRWTDDVADDDTIEAAVADYRAMWERSDAIIAGASLDDVTRIEGDVSLRWILGHLLEETARHAGHADILRELIDGDVGR